MDYRAFDSVTFDNVFTNDQGFLVAPAKLARTGIQEYLASELGIADWFPKSIVKLYRPEEEVFAPDSMRSFENSPVTLDHPKDWVDASNRSYLEKGIARNIVRTPDNYMGAEVVISDHIALDAVKNGKKELSNGYSFSVDLTPGTTSDGKAYDGVQRNIRGNHVAIVDKARCGSSCRILDSEPKTKFKGGPMADRKIVVDGIPVEVTDTVAAVIEKMEKQIQAKDSQIQGLDASIVKLTGDIEALGKDHKAEIELLKSQVMTPEVRDSMVRGWANLLKGADTLKPGIVTEGKDCESIRREALESVVKADDARSVAVSAILSEGVEKSTNDSLKIAFDVALKLTPAKQGGPTKVDDGSVFVPSNQGSGPEVLVGRDKAIKASMEAWNTKIGA